MAVLSISDNTSSPYNITGVNFGATIVEPNGATVYYDRICVSHTIGAEGEKPIEYLDGVIVGYCKDCKERVLLAKLEGGLAVQFLNAVCSQLLNQVNEREVSPDLLSEFVRAKDLLERDQAAIDAALDTARVVQGILARHLANE